MSTFNSFNEETTDAGIGEGSNMSFQKAVGTYIRVTWANLKSLILTYVQTNISASVIKSKYESNTNTNAFTDAEQTKLSGIEAGATGDQTGAEIKALYEAETNTNAFTDAEQTKLAGIEAGATADQSASEIKTAYESNADTNAFTDTEKTKLAGIETGADVTDNANVNAAGAIMDSEITSNGLINRTAPGTYSTKTAPSGTVVGTTDTQTLTNKSITPRVQSVSSSSTVTPTASDDLVIITAQAAGLTLEAPTGSPVQGQALIIRIKDNGTARAITYNAIYRAIGVTLPTTTVLSKTLYLGMIYNATDTKWDVVMVRQQA